MNRIEFDTPYMLLRDGEYGDAKAGEIVYRFNGTTYGCISWGGVAMCRVPGENPFFEVAFDNLEPVSA